MLSAGPVRIIAFISLFAQTLAGAATQSQILQSEVDLPEERHQLRFSFGMQRFDYRENHSEKLKSTEQGWLPIFSLRNEIHPIDSSLFYTLKMDYARANLMFSGTDQSANPLSPSPAGHYFWNFQATFHWKLSDPLSSDEWSIFAGLAGGHWKRGDTAVFEDKIRLREDYSWLSLPFGMRVKSESDWGYWFADTTLCLLYPSLTVRFSEYSKENQDAQLKLGASMSARIDLGTQFDLSQGWGLILNPWFQYRAFTESPTLSLETSMGKMKITEPSSRSQQFGLEFGASVEI